MGNATGNRFIADSFHVLKESGRNDEVGESLAWVAKQPALRVRKTPFSNRWCYADFRDASSILCACRAASTIPEPARDNKIRPKFRAYSLGALAS